jgi:hypothetical protein
VPGVKREKRLTKREQKALKGGPARAATSTTGEQEQEHVHCVACGRHIGPGEFQAAPPKALRLRCQHGGSFASCAGCAAQARGLLAVHDRTGQPVKQAAVWH